MQRRWCVKTTRRLCSARQLSAAPYSGTPDVWSQCISPLSFIVIIITCPLVVDSFSPFWINSQGKFPQNLEIWKEVCPRNEIFSVFVEEFTLRLTKRCVMFFSVFLRNTANPLPVLVSHQFCADWYLMLHFCFLVSWQRYCRVFPTTAVFQRGQPKKLQPAQNRFQRKWKKNNITP